MSQSAVVRVFATTQAPDYECPWQTDSPTDGTGSGVVIGDGRVLTGAHVVADATFIRVQRIADPEKFVARVHAICHDADLALLAVDDGRFMEGVEPAVLGDLPEFQDRVAVVGFPVGGDEISITEGVVSRIEVQQYSHSQRDLLAVTVDAAINDGNSGGPVLDEGDKVIGIAFQTLDNAENIGEMVPAPLIARFLRGIETERPLEVPGLGVHTQSLENDVLRDVLGMAEGEGGVLVHATDYGSTAWGFVEPGDVLLAIDGHDIANNGTIRYRQRYRTWFGAVFGERFVGDALPVRILRDGERRELSLELLSHRSLVPSDQHDRTPRWFVFGGLVFQVLTRDYLKTWGDKWWDRAPKELLHLYYLGIRTPEQREVIVLSHVLADEVNVGYAPFHDRCVASVNGHRPVNLEDFVRRVDGCEDLVSLRTSFGERILLDARAARAAGARILERYRVPSDRSPELR